MSKITKFIIAAGFAVMIASPAYAQGVKYLGHSGGTTQGDAGILGFNQLCLDTFEESQFCTSADILRSGSPPDPVAPPLDFPNDKQWVAPIHTPFTIITAIPGFYVQDITGVLVSFAGTRGMSCAGWNSASVAEAGLTMDGEGSFQVTACNAVRPAACCTNAKADKK